MTDARDRAPYEAALEDLAIEGAPVDSAARARLAAFAALLAAANARTNLTAARSPAAIAEQIRDSLRLVPLLGASLADVGSGGGFPAIPCAIVTGRPALLVESVAKKARFLEEAARTLELPCTIVTGRAEAAARELAHRERYASATARAVAGVTVVLEYAMPLLAIGGRALLQRGRTSDDERGALADAALVLGGRFVEEIASEDERRVLVVVKERPISERFPRRNGMPERKPLCVASGETAGTARD